MPISRDDIARFIDLDKLEAFCNQYKETIRLYEEGKISKEEMDTFAAYYHDRLQYWHQHLAERKKALEDVIRLFKAAAVMCKTKLN